MQVNRCVKLNRDGEGVYSVWVVYASFEGQKGEVEPRPIGDVRSEFGHIFTSNLGDCNIRSVCGTSNCVTY